MLIASWNYQTFQAEYTNNKNVYMNCIQGARDKIEQVDFFIRD